MARIMNVDYEAIPGKAQQMRSQGEELNTELTTAYQSITDMHNAWYGKRYNELVKSFNNIIPQINEMLQLVKSYKNYSVLAHMDLITRYDLNGVIDFAYIQDIVKDILEM